MMHTEQVFEILDFNPAMTQLITKQHSSEHFNLPASMHTVCCVPPFLAASLNVVILNVAALTLNAGAFKLYLHVKSIVDAPQHMMCVACKDT